MLPLGQGLGPEDTKEKECSTAYLFVGWQVIKATKLKTPPFQVTCSYFTQGSEGKKQFQHGVSMKRLQKEYLESYKKAMLWNVSYSNTSMIGMVSSHFI